MNSESVEHPELLAQQVYALKGYFDVIENNTVIQANMGQLQTVKTMIHEMTQGGKTNDDFEESLKTITKTATELNTKIDETFARISDKALTKPKNKFEERLQTLETKKEILPRKSERTKEQEEKENASLKGQPSHQMNHR